MKMKSRLTQKQKEALSEIKRKTQKKHEHSYLFLVPNDEDGRTFYKLCRKYIDSRYKIKRRGNHSDRIGLYKKLGKTHTSLMDVPIKHAENWRIYIGVKKSGILYQGNWLSYHLFKALKRARDARLVNLMQELQREFRTKSTNESTAVVELMRRLLASYVAGKFKGKYE